MGATVDADALPAPGYLAAHPDALSLQVVLGPGHEVEVRRALLQEEVGARMVAAAHGSGDDEDLPPHLEREIGQQHVQCRLARAVAVPATEAVVADAADAR